MTVPYHVFGIAPRNVHFWDMTDCTAYVCFWPKADINSLDIPKNWRGHFPNKSPHVAWTVRDIGGTPVDSKW